MAPLLGRKAFPLVKPSPDSPEPGEQLYLIPHTGETFTNKLEYEMRLQKYNENIWTCKSTGSSQLTHKEAWEEEQEVTELLQEEFPVWFEKPVLEIVHHNTVSLDKLVDKAWLEVLTKYAVGEECDFLEEKDRRLRVMVLKVLPLEKVKYEPPENKLEGDCNSPSSDKENANHEAQRKEQLPAEAEKESEGTCERTRRSSRKQSIYLKEEKKKFVFPKFLPHKYDVKLMNEDKIMCGVPADGLFRSERPPTKEILRYFIRHYALRVGLGENAPWVVEDKLVKKYSLPDKLSDFQLDLQKFMAETPSAKRKSVISLEGKPTKKRKIVDATRGGCVTNGEEKMQNRGKKISGGPLKVKNSSYRGDGDLTNFQKDNVSRIQPYGKAPMQKSESKKLRALRAAVHRVTKKGEKGAEKPNTKQMTLHDLDKCVTKASSRTPKHNKLLPLEALHLLRYHRENKDKEDKRHGLSSLVSKAAKVLTPEERERLPEELRDMVEKRAELLEYKQRWAAMTQEEKRDEMRRKRREIEKVRRVKEMQVRMERLRRFEDQELQGKNLPNFKLLDMPEGLPNMLFGDIAMVTDFLNCFSGLLMPDEQHAMSAPLLIEAVTAEKGGFFHLNHMLVVLLQTLLQDELAEAYSELDMPLSEIPLTLHSVSELVRLCLRPSDAYSEGSSDGLVGDNLDHCVGGDILEKLETTEVFELQPQEKVNLLVTLCHRILMTYSLEDHVESMQQRSGELWKERLAALKETNKLIRVQKQQRNEVMEAKAPSSTTQEKTKEEADSEQISVEEKPMPEDIASAVKSRRLQAIKAKKEKEELEKLNKDRTEKEAIEAELECVRKQKAAVEKVFQDGINKAKLVIRRVALGTDRNHNRYWLFSDVVPGLYIERGWIHDSIDYSFTQEPEEETNDVEKDEGSIEGLLQKDHPPYTITKIETCIETTAPKCGQNLWFVCDTVSKLDELIDSLHSQGVRESELKNRLQFRYQDIVRSIHLSCKTSPGLKSCDGHQELLRFLRSDILEVASRLQKGGLGNVTNFVEFEQKVCSLESLKDFGESIVSLQKSVVKKFLQGFMAPKQHQKKKKKKQKAEENRMDEAGEERRLTEEAWVVTTLEKWKEMIWEAQTFSRMHVLLGMLDACIKWDMSAENAQCKVCRKKGQDDKLVLCDGCNKAFHLFCLRPVLYSIPEGEWLCPVCQPVTARHGSRGRNYHEEVEGWSDEDNENIEEESEMEEVEENEKTGHNLRSRKALKNKQSKPVQKTSGMQPARTSTAGKPKGPPRNPADIDELVRRSTGVHRRPVELEKYEEILTKLVKLRYSWPFREPVSAREAEDYLEVISSPMDFSTMLRKFSEGQYGSGEDFLRDMKLVFCNAEEYNQPSSVVLSCLARTEQVFTELLHKLLPHTRYTREHVSMRTPHSSDRERKRSKPSAVSGRKGVRWSARRCRHTQKPEEVEEVACGRKTRSRTHASGETGDQERVATRHSKRLRCSQ